MHNRLGRSPSQEKSRKGQHFKNWRENLLLLVVNSQAMPPNEKSKVNLGAAANVPCPSLPSLLSYFRAFFTAHVPGYLQPLERRTCSTFTRRVNRLLLTNVLTFL